MFGGGAKKWAIAFPLLTLQTHFTHQNKPCKIKVYQCTKNLTQRYRDFNLLNPGDVSALNDVIISQPDMKDWMIEKLLKWRNQFSCAVRCATRYTSRAI